MDTNSPPRTSNDTPCTRVNAERPARCLQRDYPASPYVFPTERHGPLTDSAARKIVARAGAAVANDGHDTRADPAQLRSK